MTRLGDSDAGGRHGAAARMAVRRGISDLRPLAHNLAQDIRSANGREPEQILGSAGFKVRSERSGAAKGGEQASVETRRNFLVVICDPDPAPDERWQVGVLGESSTLGGIWRKRLAHELGHIVLNAWLPTDSPGRRHPDDREEVFCDLFATELLLGGEAPPPTANLTQWASERGVDLLTAADHWASWRGSPICVGLVGGRERWSHTFGPGFAASDLRVIHERLGLPSNRAPRAWATPFLAAKEDGVLKIEDLSTVGAIAA